MKVAQKFLPKVYLPPKREVKSKVERIHDVLSNQQNLVIDSLWRVVDPTALSKTVQLTSIKAGLPKWLVLQELHYREQVCNLFEFDCVDRKGNIDQEDMFDLFPLLAPLARLGIPNELCRVLEEEPYRRLKDRFGRNRQLSIRYVLEFFSLPVSREDLVSVVRGHIVDSKGWTMTEADREARDQIKKIDSTLKMLRLASLRKSRENKALSRFLAKSPGLQRNSLTEEQIKVLYTLRWGKFQLVSEVFPHLEPEKRLEKVNQLSRQAMSILLDDDNFNRSSTFFHDHL